jgi:hypothetical protein
MMSQLIENRNLFWRYAPPYERDQISQDMHCLLPLDFQGLGWNFAVCGLCIDFTSSPQMDGWWYSPHAGTARQYCDDCRRFLFVRLGLWEGMEHA